MDEDDAGRSLERQSDRIQFGGHCAGTMLDHCRGSVGDVFDLIGDPVPGVGIREHEHSDLPSFSRREWASVTPGAEEIGPSLLNLPGLHVASERVGAFSPQRCGQSTVGPPVTENDRAQSLLIMRLEEPRHRLGRLKE
jgi:hypothetical protein